MKRFDVIKKIVSLLKDELIICNIGIPSQELYSIQDSEHNFYMLGSMGMASSIGLGLSLNTDRKVVAIDGDGSILMNLGSLVTIANQNPVNLIHIIIDNSAYGSTGNQPTYTAGRTSIASIAKGAGIESVKEIQGMEIGEELKKCLEIDGPHIIVVKVESGNAKVGVIPLSPFFIRDRFMKTLKEK